MANMAMAIQCAGLAQALRRNGHVRGATASAAILSEMLNYRSQFEHSRCDGFANDAAQSSVSDSLWQPACTELRGLHAHSKANISVPNLLGAPSGVAKHDH